MPAVLTAIGTDATNSFEDLSGISVLVQRKQKYAGGCNGCTTGGEGCTTASSSPPVSPSSNSTDMSDTDDEIDNPYDVLIQVCENDPVGYMHLIITAKNGANRYLSLDAHCYSILPTSHSS